MIPLYSLRSLAVRHAASTDETRYHLNGVRFEADGSTVATDGHVLMHADEGERPDPNEIPSAVGQGATKGKLEPFTLPRDSAEALAKHLKAARKMARTSLPILAYTALDREAANKSDLAEFRLTDLETTQNVMGRKIEGEYPNWQQIIQGPDQQPMTSVTLGAHLIAKVLKAAAEFNPDGRCVRIEVFGVESEGDRADYFGPVRFTVNNPEGGKLQAWVMPMRQS